MQFIKISFIIILALYVILLFIFAYKSRRFVRSITLSSMLGIGVLAIINLLSKFTGIVVPTNIWTVGSSAIFSIPGVLGILALRLFF